MSTPARKKDQTVAKDPAVLEAEDNAATAAEPRTNVRCDNHPDRKARTFSGNGAYSLNLCAECTPPWFVADE